MKDFTPAQWKNHSFSRSPEMPIYQSNTMSGAIMRKLTSLLLACLSLALLTPAWAGDIRALIQKAKPAVVQIGAFDQAGQLVKTGSGFFITKDGRLLTNRHVISDAASILAKDYRGTTYHLKSILAVSQDTDVAELQFDATNVSFLTLGPTTGLVEGERVIVIGSPEGLEGTVSDGIIAAFRENRSIIQITAAVSPGSSGSPVLDAESGEVIGIATSILREGQNLNFSISTEAAVGALAKDFSIPPSLAPVAKTTPPSSTTENSGVFQVAVIAWENKNYEMAISGFDEEIAQLDAWDKVGTPVNLEASKNHRARVYALRGDAQRHLKHYGNAIRDYTEAIRFCPDAEFSYAGRSKVYNAIGNHSQAEQDRKKAMEVGTQNETKENRKR